MVVLMATTTTKAMTQKNGNEGNNVHSSSAAADLNPTFHDFLGCASGSPLAATAPKAAFTAADFRLSEASTPSASASIGASADLGSERQVPNHFEGVPLYGAWSDHSGPESSNRFKGYKRSNSDSVFMVSSRDGIPQMGPDSVENAHLNKILKNGEGGDRGRRSADEEVLFVMQSRRPTSGPLALQSPTSSSRPDANISKFDRSAALNVVATAQYPVRVGQFAPIAHQVPANRFRDMNAGGPSIISHSAADEGSRTGMKGSGILISVSPCSGASEKCPSTVTAGGSKPKPGVHISDPESSTTPSQHGITSVSPQMTIFYGGQAHVFDDVHPNKADVIMTMAGSNGGSWSTTYSPKSSMKPISESYAPNGENEMAIVSNTVYSQDFHGRLSVTGGHRSCLIADGSRNPVQVKPSVEEKR